MIEHQKTKDFPRTFADIMRIKDLYILKFYTYDNSAPDPITNKGII